MSHSVIKGTLILTIAGLIAKCVGFYYKIFLAGTIGAEGIGLYQLVFPILGIAMAICSMGIEAAISRFCAREKDSSAVFTSAFCLSMTLSIIVTIAFIVFSDFISSRLLFNSSTKPLIAPLAISIPFSCMHQCINGYYYGLKDTKIPAISQIFEQFVRISSVILINMYYVRNNVKPDAALAVYGILIGEFGAGIFSLIAILGKRSFSFKFTKFFFHLKKIITMAFPLTCNRLLLMLLQSGESILIPIQLMLYGHEQSEAMSIYGVLTGMALSFIAFPATITQSAALMLLPTVSKAQYSNDNQSISQSISTAFSFSLCMGIFCVGGFFFFGGSFGGLIFHNDLVCTIIKVLSFLCPFLYLNSTLTGIINGLGKTGVTFTCNIIGVVIRLIFIIKGIPLCGLNGYMYGLLLSHVIISISYVTYLFKTHPFNLDIVNSILKPAIYTFISIGFSLAISKTLPVLNINAYVSLIFNAALAFTVYIILCLPQYRKMI